MRDMGQRNRGGDGDTAFVLLLENDVWRLLVDPDSESLQFVLDDPLVRQRLVDVENDEDKVAGLCDSNNLPTTTLAILGSLNNSGQV